jgi:hypothetical protein
MSFVYYFRIRRRAGLGQDAETGFSNQLQIFQNPAKPTTASAESAQEKGLASLGSPFSERAFSRACADAARLFSFPDGKHGGHGQLGARRRLLPFVSCCAGCRCCEPSEKHSTKFRFTEVLVSKTRRERASSAAGPRNVRKESVEAKLDPGALDPRFTSIAAGSKRRASPFPIDKTARTMASTRLPWTETTAP